MAPLQISIGASPPLVVQTSPALIQLLVGIHLEEWVDVLANLGVTEVPDLQHLTDAELSATGMLLVHLRKLRAAAGPPAPEAGIPVQLAAFGSKLPFTLQPKLERMQRFEDPNVVVEATIDGGSGLATANSRGLLATTAAEAADQAAQIVQYAATAQTVAPKALATALSIGGRDDVEEIIKWTKACVDCPNSSLEIVASALIATSRALVSCPAGDLNAALVIAEKLVRDVLIWMVQLHTPLGDRFSFVACLTAAVGAENMDSNMFSHLMHSHSKEVCPKFPHAFLSNAKLEALKRKGRRPARTRPKTKLGEDLGNEEPEVEVEVEEYVKGEVEEYVEGEFEEYNEEEFLQHIRAETEAFLQMKEVEVEVKEDDEEEFPNQMRAELLPGVAAAWLGSGSSLATGHQAVARLGLVDHRGREAARKVVLAVVKQLSVEEAVEVLEQAKKAVLEQAMWRS